nr:HNH endonuclease signature motif containing protein [Ferrovum sp.]
MEMPGYCAEHQRKARKQCDERRGSATSRGYGARWRQARAVFLATHPLCAACEGKGRITPAQVVDHVIPHRGDKQLFWDRNNWQALCKRCHDIKTTREDGGFGNPSNR